MMSTWGTNIFAGVVANLLSSLLVLAAALFWLYRHWFARRLAGFFRPPDPAGKAIIRSKAFAQPPPSTTFQVLAVSPFRHPLPPDQREILRQFLDASAGKPSWNGTLVRLDRVQLQENSTSLYLSRVGFHDLLTTNIAFAAGPQTAPVSTLLQPALWPLASQAAGIIVAHRTSVYAGIDRKQPSFDQVLACPHLANALAVALCIVDPEGNAIIAERRHGVAVGTGKYTAAVTGSIAEPDLAAGPDPIRAACAREAFQELAFSIHPENISLVDIVIAAGKLQPIALCTYHSEKTAQEIARSARFGEEVPLETQRLLALDMKDPSTAARVLLRLDFSPASRYLLWKLLSQSNGPTMSALAKQAARRWAMGWGIRTTRRWLKAGVLQRFLH